MIIGIGNDLVEIRRFKDLKNKTAFADKYYTEREVCASKGRPSFLAANFSVKESVSKVFGTGIRGFSLKEIEVLRDEYGKPYVNLFGKAKELAQNLGIKTIHVSITDTEELVMTMAVGEDS